ncbi:sialate O-acetylesterase [Maribacter sp. 2-571]|uniref:sialate O-acetylesterase n=1 Tax=Maribacter sp. 2-571 TaxID=3417569 RepID=UPI003D35616B
MGCRHFLFVCSLLFGMFFGHAKIELPNIFSDHMVLQRNTDVTLWGWGSPNESIKVFTEWDGKSYSVSAGVDAKWSLLVPTPDAGGPYQVRFEGQTNTIELTDVLIGEVWLCSGQSNMEWSANSGIDNADTEIKAADYPNIRFFTVIKRTAEAPQENVSGTWSKCDPKEMADFSAVAYYFGKRLQGALDVPIGLIDAAWGASSAEVWTPQTVFEQRSDLAESAKKIRPNKWVSVQPSSLYNAMIAPLHRFKIAGTLWYQGESNTANAEKYSDLFTTMIRSWRTAWNADFPFYFVQIAPYTYGSPEEGVQVRDQQRRALSLTNTGMVLTSDICTVDDIHPKNKKDVGLRLANMALKKHYGAISEEVNGPLFKEFERNGSKLRIVFDHAEGLTAKGKKIDQFELAGPDGVFYPAKAKIKGDVIIASSKKVSDPVRVRFAWNNTDMAQLFNGVGLPASSFTSD